jgi:hypothetical protein
VCSGELPESLSPSEREAFEERAGIKMFDGGIERVIAERQALQEVLGQRQTGRSGAGMPGDIHREQG